jgi:hypothetical protein
MDKRKQFLIIFLSVLKVLISHMTRWGITERSYCGTVKTTSQTPFPNRREIRNLLLAPDSLLEQEGSNI